MGRTVFLPPLVDAGWRVFSTPLRPQKMAVGVLQFSLLDLPSQIPSNIPLEALGEMDMTLLPALPISDMKIAVPPADLEINSQPSHRIENKFVMSEEKS